jgi:hypothetical protein
MKFILSSFLITFLFSGNTQLDKKAIYICPFLGDKFEIFRVVDDSVLIYSNYIKHPDYVYDFYEKKNLGFVKETFTTEKKFINENRCTYKCKGDSIFIDRNTSKLLDIKINGIIKNGKVYATSLYRIFNQSTLKYEVVRKDEGLVFTPY